jgi:hypothetical protein
MLAILALADFGLLSKADHGWWEAHGKLWFSWHHPAMWAEQIIIGLTDYLAGDISKYVPFS